jgi:EAL domain-containing protein (putative c-di-GMP-specific phosphodiesterase class I)
MDHAAPPSVARERRSPTPAAAQKREAVRHLKQALVERRFVLHYQPIVSVRDGSVASVEALLRWKDPAVERDALAGLVWLVEHSPVIFRLQDWALSEACQAAAAWRGTALAGLRMNVNVSAQVLPRSRLAGRLRRQLRAARLAPDAIALEITETSRMDDFTAVGAQLDRLGAMGAELWLDDFGTGHSSLEWLSRLPVHGVKLAPTFASRLDEDRCRTIVTHVVRMAHDLGLRVIAEGVETEAQRDFLAGLGCDFLQGFLLCPPVAAADLPATLAKRGALAGPPSAGETNGRG